MSPFALQSESLDLQTPEFLLQAAQTFVIGRSSKCDFVVNHETVSRRHAEFTFVDGKIVVRDLDSHNGTFIDDRRTRTGTLEDGQRVRFGSVSFCLRKQDRREPGSDVATSNGKAAPEAPEACLSAAQRRVLQHLLQGLSEKKIASRLKLSTATVHNHVQAIYRVLKVHSRPELLARLLRRPSRL